MTMMMIRYNIDGVASNNNVQDWFIATIDCIAVARFGYKDLYPLYITNLMETSEY